MRLPFPVVLVAPNEEEYRRSSRLSAGATMPPSTTHQQARVMFKIIGSATLGAVVTAAAFVLNGLFASAPHSSLASPAASAAGDRMKQEMTPYVAELISADIQRRREIIDSVFFAPRIKTARERFDVTERAETMNGVYVEVFEPAAGVSVQHQRRVLINLHGGGFSMGARTEGRLESIPVAATAGMRVISVDYRQGPEYQFPAASEDVASVYQHLLSAYAPENIGIFGCSAGGMLTAQAIAWFDAHQLPQPGAIGIFCAGAGRVDEGDSVTIADHFGTNLGGGPIEYFAQARWDDPLVAPVNHPAVLAHFPDTLIISSTRDFAMSAALHTHYQLVAQGVPSELHIYEGLRHYFFADTELPESQHAFDVMARFFDRHLGG